MENISLNENCQDAGSKIEIFGINGPVVSVKNSPNLDMLEMCYVGNERLIGEVIGIRKDNTMIQVYEETTGLKIHEPVVPAGSSMAMTLGPGLISNIYDGIGRPLRAIEAESGSFISRGLTPASVDMDKKWDVKILAKSGDKVGPCSIIAETSETSLIKNKVMIPNGVRGTIQNIVSDGEYSCSDTIAEVLTGDGQTVKITMVQKWPIRKPRPFKERHISKQPLITGQRIIDTLFPLAKGGTAAIPGGFGTGKTMAQHQLAKWSDSDIIIYIGCGERGNEMTEVLEDFSKLVDPRSNKPLMERTLLIANTSNMPVAAREASIYTGVTIAEYYRDMGYNVAIMADSTSRWAEALREISGRLEEMPAEEGFPAYLPSRLSEFYERAGMVTSLNGETGSVSIIGAVSPQGGDFSEPVTQNTKRFTRCFWALDKSLAYARHYPAINWIDSYSEYTSELSDWYAKNVSEDFVSARTRIADILREENDLLDIVKLVGSDVLPDSQKIVLEIARIIRVGFLQQNAFQISDAYIPLDRQYDMISTILHLYDKCKEWITAGKTVDEIKKTGITDDVAKIKYSVNSDGYDKFASVIRKIDDCKP